MFPPKKIAVLISLSLLSGFVSATSVEFDASVLDSEDKGNVDLTRFSEENYIMPGAYLLDVNVNQQKLPPETIRYVPSGEKKTKACIPKSIVDALALKKEALELITQWDDNTCLDIEKIPGLQIKNRQGRLDIIIPQAWMKYSDPNWVPPERWDHGVSGVLFDYNVNSLYNHDQNSGESRNDVSAYGTAGLNAGAWRFRGNYQAHYSDNDTDNSVDINWSQFYAFRPLPMIAAKLSVGELYMNSQVFDGFRYIGASLASDERMLPPSLRGYAPEIRGVAKSNAKVTVSQQGRIIYETTVPAGPFNIQDLRSSVRGTLDVRVEEQGGNVSTFQVDTANIPYLTRPGYVRYNTSVGRPALYDHDIEGPGFYSGDFSWGITNAWSLYGGLLLAGSSYNAWSLGIGRDLSIFGALSADITQSYSQVPGEDKKSGSSFKLSYAKTFDESHSSITFAGYKFSERNFRTMTQYLDERYGDVSAYGNDKEMYTITANKSFMADDPVWATTVYLNYSHRTYWDAASQDRYGLSVGKNFDIGDVKGISVNISAYRSDYRDTRDDSLSLNVSVPIGDSKSLGYDQQVYNSKSTQMVSYSDNSDSNNMWRIRAGTDSEGNASTDAYYMHRAEAAEVNFNASYRQDAYASVGASIRGGMTATGHGVALHNSSTSNGGTRVMVGTDGISGVSINNRRATSNMFGVAVVPDVDIYRTVDTRIDVDQLDDDIEASKAIVQSTLTEGAIAYRKFDVQQGLKFLAILRLRDGSFPPFGAAISTPEGKEVAMVDDGGNAFITGAKAGDRMTVRWDATKQCHFIVPETVDPAKTLLTPCTE